MPSSKELRCNTAMNTGYLSMNDIAVVRYALSDAPIDLLERKADLTAIAKASYGLMALIVDNVSFELKGITIARAQPGSVVANCEGDNFQAGPSTYVIDYVFKMREKDWLWSNWKSVASLIESKLHSESGLSGAVQVVGYEIFDTSSSVYNFWNSQPVLFAKYASDYSMKDGWIKGSNSGFSNFCVGTSEDVSGLQPIKFSTPTPGTGGGSGGGNASPPALPPGTSSKSSATNVVIFAVAAYVAYAMVSGKL